MTEMPKPPTIYDATVYTVKTGATTFPNVKATNFGDTWVVLVDTEERVTYIHASVVTRIDLAPSYG